MDDFGSFTDVLDRLRSKSRDPRSIRLSSVASAITDVVEGDVKPAKVYASAVTTLEGMLLTEHETAEDLLNSLDTQTALLRIFAAVVPYVPPATLRATVGPTSRVLRASVSSSATLTTNEDNLREGRQEIFETKDGLGATNTLLSSGCEATAEFLRHIPETTDGAQIRQLLNEILMPLLQDSSRPKIQTAAKDALCSLLLMKSPQCHSAIRKTITKYVTAMLDRYQTQHSTNQQQQSSSQNMIELMGFLNPALTVLDFTNIGGRIMTILVNLLNEESSSTSNAARPVFVARSHAATLHILTINATLSTILSLLENGNEDSESDRKLSKTESQLNAFAARVLASLVQIRSTLVFRKGAAENDLLESGRFIYGQVMLSASQRLIRDSNTAQIGAKLLPLVVQQIIGLSGPIEEESESGIGEALFVEVSQLIRTDFQRLRDDSVQLHANCSFECLRVIGSVVQPPFDEVHVHTLRPLSLLLQQLDPIEKDAAKAIQGLIQLRLDTSLRDETLRTIDAALLSLVEGIGLESFWGAIDFTSLCLSLSRSAASNNYSWIFDVMKGSMVGSNRTHLSFFQQDVLPLARKFDALFVSDVRSSQTWRNYVVNFWGLFPIFCRLPSDLEASLPDLAPILLKAMNDIRFPELISIICNGLDVLASGVLQRKHGFQELIDGDEARAVRSDLEVLGQVSTKLLPSLFKIVDGLHESKVDENMVDHAAKSTDIASKISSVTLAIASIARVVPRPQVNNLFAKVVQRMLQTMQSEDGSMVEKMASLLSLAQSLVVSECLEETSIELLYRSLKPLIRTDDTVPKIQKRAYKLLCEICKRYHSFIVASDRLEDVLSLLSSTSATSQIGARFMRLKCLTIVIEGFEESPKDVCQNVVTPMVGEVLLCLKDSNAKTRDAGFALLLSMAKIYGDHANFLQIVSAAIGSDTSHMRSAAVTALARLVFEINPEDPDVQKVIPSIMQTVLILADDPSREVTKSMVIFIRVCVSAASAEQLKPLLPDIISGLLKYHRGRDRFRAKIKIIIKKLVKLFGYDALMPFVPQSDTRLLTHMRKLSEREARRRKSHSYQFRDDKTAFEDMEDSEGEEDSDDGLTLVTGMTRKSRLSRVTSRRDEERSLKHGHADTTSIAKSFKSLRGHPSVRIKNDAKGEILDVKELKTVTFADANLEEDDDSVDLEFNASGKLVVHDFSDAVSTKREDDGELSCASIKSKHNLSKQRKNPEQHKRNTEKQKKKISKPGQAYKAKKAGGDMKKKGQKYEPYAYVQLDGRSYSRKNRRAAVEQMGAVVQRGNKRQRR